MRVRAVLFCLAAMLALAVPGRAQWAVYAQGTGATLRISNAGHLYGPSFGFYDMKHNGPLSYGMDFRATTLWRANLNGQYTDERMDLGLVGLRVGFTPHGTRFTPYAEALGGFGYWRGGAGLTRQDKSGANLQGVAGLDVRILPKIDWRAVEFSYGRQTGEIHSIDPITASTGIVARF